MDLALTREVSRRINACQLSFVDRQPIDYKRAVAQHRDYCQALQALGVEVLGIPAEDSLPDCCFIEDTAVVLDELAIVTRMGSAARRPETPAVEAALAPHRTMVRMDAPATLDGGDVLQLGRTLYIGITKRTNEIGAEVVRLATAKYGYSTVPIEVRGCLHLKSAVSALDDATLIANPIWVDPKAFPGIEVLSVPSKEPGAANVQRVGERLIVHEGFPQTIEVLVKRGHAVQAVDVSEFLKAEAGVTCKSILFRRR